VVHNTIYIPFAYQRFIMRFSASVILSGLVATSLAAPFAGYKRQNGTVSAAVAGAGAVLTARPYADFQISDGVAGDAMAEAMAKFPVCTSTIYFLVLSLTMFF
jgi:hypothetical protein